MAGIFGLLMSGAGVLKDQYFNLTSLLLPGNGTNGATNNSFVDSSTANSGTGWPITRNGDVTQGTFSPFSQTGWGAYFDGTNDYVSTPDSTAFTMGSGDFTIEYWTFFLGGSDIRVYGQADTTPTLTSVSYSGGNNASNKVINNVFSGSTKYECVSTQDFPTNQWVHIAFVRNGNTLRQYVNGTQDGTASVTGVTINDSSNQFAIGRAGEYNGLYWKGYISNLRITKGACLYPNGTSFTPSTSPLTTSVSSGTVSLLALQNNRFIDNAATPNTLTPNNGVAITPFSPFAPTSSYSASAVGGSGYFDGGLDYLTIADTTELELGSSNFTIEAWIYPTATPGASGATIIGKNSATYPGGYEFNLVLDNAKTISFNVYTTTLVSLQGTTVLPLNAWTHVAASRSGNDYAIYVNGSREDLDSAGGTIQATSSSIYIGEYGGGGRVITGYISSLRVVKGSYVYNPSSTSVTIPTAPLTAITDTKLLLNFTNAGVVDATAKNVLETEGNAQISTAQSKWGGGSMYFDGTTGYLYEPSSQNFAFGTGDFTIEFWLYMNSVTGVQVVYDNRPANGAYPTIYLNGAVLTYYTNSTQRITGGSLSTGVWYHIAVSRSGTNTKLFINGTQSGSTYTDSTNYLAGPLVVAADIAGGTPAQLSNCYVDDLRITKGYARYTANFTAPTAPFPVQ